MKHRNIKKFRARMKRKILPTVVGTLWFGVTPTRAQFKQNQKRGQHDADITPHGRPRAFRDPSRRPKAG